MGKELFILLLILGAVSLGECQSYRTGRCPRPGGGGPGGSPGVCLNDCSPWGSRCPRGQLCCRNRCGTHTCMFPRLNIPRWCPPGSPRLNCFANPCQVETCPRFPNARCVNDNPCEPSCVANWYIGFRRIPRWQCQSRG